MGHTHHVPVYSSSCTNCSCLPVRMSYLHSATPWCRQLSTQILYLLPTTSVIHQGTTGLFLVHCTYVHIILSATACVPEPEGTGSTIPLYHVFTRLYNVPWSLYDHLPPKTEFGSPAWWHYIIIAHWSACHAFLPCCLLWFFFLLCFSWVPVQQAELLALLRGHPGFNTRCLAYSCHLWPFQMGQSIFWIIHTVYMTRISSYQLYIYLTAGSALAASRRDAFWGSCHMLILQEPIKDSMKYCSRHFA